MSYANNRASVVTTKTATTMRTTRPKSGLVPTNTIVTKDGQQIRAKIDATLSVSHVIRTLCINLSIPDPPKLYALRDENDVLVTNDNLRKMIKTKAKLKYVFALAFHPINLTPYARLVSAPEIEAAEILEKLRDEKTQRLALFSLAKYIRGNLIRVAYRRKTTPVDPHGNQRHAGALSYIWTAGKLQEEVAVQDASVLSAPKDVR
ncbi:hypothetical protein EXIGLDRAFT_707149 [Exidia glandulosa HHB12029]|uniref:Uncharacterized protein n=1 Tax=Exidia glandulosa HHB12029 TaxID=1314781 RepID=A0A165ATU7_EXIGL|nr:hypothetical protein EXIGLDRAFT_707149 [Exidia glandulosa HHB12029]